MHENEERPSAAEKQVKFRNITVVFGVSAAEKPQELHDFGPKFLLFLFKVKTATKHFGCQIANTFYNHEDTHAVTVCIITMNCSPCQEHHRLIQRNSHDHMIKSTCKKKKTSQHQRTTSHKVKYKEMSRCCHKCFSDDACQQKIFLNKQNHQSVSKFRCVVRT